MTSVPMDNSHGYEANAADFLRLRGTDPEGTGVEVLRRWVRQLPVGAEVLDVGCGTGVPVSRALVDAGMRVWGIDASPTLLAAFRERFPEAEAACEPVETSDYFGRSFDAVVACGLLFLLSEADQVHVLRKWTLLLRPGARLLFTAPRQSAAWTDVLTGAPCLSLGRQRYERLLEEGGLSRAPSYTDRGGNHYYQAVRN